MIAPRAARGLGQRDRPAGGAAVRGAFGRVDPRPGHGLLGPIGLRGGVQLVGADGFAYEVRNRMALCRCGASKNKPFCDGSHISTGFSDER
ncbi:CDGSH iron-sulfur domain-containing protein [Acidovorax carolinensis]|uniref:CDGSH iron-sulfur domain-containing protein n=1 Tax=Acidovorax carolinensis TaxID=553814 RepID=UPI002150125A|nr:CDGSH iron-sulfur domain-containing protein [Acidovorax carolinensis]